MQTLGASSVPAKAYPTSTIPTATATATTIPTATIIPTATATAIPKKIVKLMQNFKNGTFNLYNRIKNNKRILTVFLIIAVLFLIYISYQVYTNIYNTQQTEEVYLKDETDGTTMTIVDSDSVPSSYGSLSYTISVWLYINKDGYKQSDENEAYKHILHRGDEDAVVCQPGVWLSTENNNLLIKYKTGDSNTCVLDESSLNETESMNPNMNLTDNSETIELKNIALNRWIHLTIVGNENIVQVYINGELIKTNVSESSIEINNGNIYIGGDDTTDTLSGFNGKITQLKYYGESKKASDIQKIYLKGPNPFMLPDLSEASKYTTDILNSNPLGITTAGETILSKVKYGLDYSSDVMSEYI